jgi:signal transduction histidine kinase
MTGPSEVVSRVRRSIAAGRWSLTPEQAEYFLSSLPGAESFADSPYLDSLAFARRLQAVLAGERLPDTVTTARATIAVDGTVDDIFFKPQSPGLSIGISTDREYVRNHVILDAASRAAPGVAVEIHAETPQKSAFHTRSPVWRVSVPEASSVSVWRRADVLMFVAGTVVVLGVLVLGVVLLARDVARDTLVNRMRADLVSGVSHELKTPLSVIRVYAEMLDGASDASETDRPHFVAAIVQETDRLKRLIDDVVDFSRIQQGERVYPMTAGPIVEVITRAVDRFRRYAELHGFALNADIAVVNHAVVFDPLAVEQAILNLLDNALKYSGDAGQIDLRLFESGSHIVVEIEDYGVGIAAEDRARIFERFHRGAHADRGGYGLGLYLVRHIMDAHGGDVRVHSVRGQGSTFSLRFPVVPEEQHAKSLAGGG